MLRVLLFVSSALASFAAAYWLGPATLLVCPALALASVVWSMQDSRAMKSASSQERPGAFRAEASARQESAQLEH